MPLIKSAKKRMKQNRVRRARNFPLRNEMKTVFKHALDLIKDGKLEEAQKYTSRAYSIIDMASKKNIIHKNNAANKKSRIARALNALEEKGKKVEGVDKKETEKAEESA